MSKLNGDLVQCVVCGFQGTSHPAATCPCCRTEYSTRSQPLSWYRSKEELPAALHVLLSMDSPYDVVVVRKITGQAIYHVGRLAEASCADMISSIKGHQKGDILYLDFETGKHLRLPNLAAQLLQLLN